MNRRLHERQLMDSKVMLRRGEERIPCRINDISEGGVCILVGKTQFGEDVPACGSEMQFEFVSDEAENNVVPIYTCTIMHVQEDGDNYKIGVAVSEEVSG